MGKIGHINPGQGVIDQLKIVNGVPVEYALVRVAAHHHNFVDRKIKVSCALLHHYSHLSGDLAGGNMPHIGTIQLNDAGIGLENAVDGAQQAPVGRPRALRHHTPPELGRLNDKRSLRYTFYIL